MASWGAGGGFARGTYVMLAWIFSLAALPFAIWVVVSSVQLSIGSPHQVPWWAGDIFVVAQIGLFPMAYISLSRATAGRMRSSVAAINAAAILAIEIISSQLVSTIT